MAVKKVAKPELYKVVSGCDTADGKRYEEGDSYLPNLHEKEVTEALLRLKAIEVADGDSQ